jgi:hypothetical protein
MEDLKEWRICISFQPSQMASKTYEMLQKAKHEAQVEHKLLNGVYVSKVFRSSI